MALALILVLLTGVASPRLPAVNGSVLWEETPDVEMAPGYHPKIRFSSWDITRFNRSSTYMFSTPDFVQQGQFSMDGTHYTFRAVMANELENSDISKLTAAMNPEEAQKLAGSYARSMSNFEGDYDSSTRTLRVSYPVNGHLQSFELHATNEGDDQLTSVLSAGEGRAAGLWYGADPYPERLDAKTRGKIGGLEGLQQFGHEAMFGDGATLTLLDVRVDKSFRLGAILGTWELDGSTLKLFLPKGQVVYLEVSNDGSKLRSNGKTIYLRG